MGVANIQVSMINWLMRYCQANFPACGVLPSRRPLQCGRRFFWARWRSGRMSSAAAVEADDAEQQELVPRRGVETP